MSNKQLTLYSNKQRKQGTLPFLPLCQQ